jgi:hypothetical protein
VNQGGKKCWKVKRGSEADLGYLSFFIFPSAFELGRFGGVAGKRWIGL